MPSSLVLMKVWAEPERETESMNVLRKTDEALEAVILPAKFALPQMVFISEVVGALEPR